MDKARQDFELVFSEAFAAGTGQDWNSENVQTDFTRFLGMRAELCSLRASADSELPVDAAPVRITTLGVDGVSMNHARLIEAGPSPDMTGEEYSEVTARLCFLGSSLLRVAKQSLANLNVPTLRSGDNGPRGLDGFYNFMRGRNWADEHRGVSLREREKDPESPSPLRLANWPEGDYVNCLGVSIALTAYAQEQGLKMLYCNELRTSDEAIEKFHQALLKKLGAAWPEFRDDPAAKLLSYIWEEINDWTDDDEEDSRNMPIIFEPQSTLLPESRIRDFHHCIIVQIPDRADWVQYDPYKMTYASMVRPEQGNFIKQMLDSQKLIAPGSVVVFQDSYIEDVYRQIDLAAKVAIDFARTNKDIDIKDKTRLKAAAKEIADSVLYVISTFYETEVAEIEGAEGESFHSHVALKACDTVLLAAASELLDNFDPIELLRREGQKDDHKASESAHADLANAIDTILDRLPHDRRARELVNKYYAMIPTVMFLELYGATLNGSFNIKRAGIADTASEFADPEFMIGAMHLNHYATWRKDGRVNVARYLVRLTSSQLIWHDALQDEDAREDYAVRRVAEQIGELPRKMLHPRVNILRSLFPTRGDAHGTHAKTRERR